MNYTKATNFATKDTLLTGNPQKLIKGTEINAEFDSIATAISTKEDKLPTGIIVIWSGAVANIPTGWALCDGLNSTPDLRDRFVVGSGLNYNVGATGGVVTATTANTAVTTDAGGSHTHGGFTASHALTVAQIPAHSHTFVAGRKSNIDASTVAVDLDTFPGSELTNVSTANTGGGAGHTHGIGDSGTHTHTVAGHAHTVDTRSPYYALAYIMKL